LKYGSNKLTDKKKLSPYIVFFNQLKDVMIIILIVAAFISALIGDLKDAVVILIIVVLNSIIGFIQEYRAEKAMEALKKMATLNALVRRDGNVSMRSATDLVPGDIVLLEAGMQVPADLRLIETLSLKIDEASLTGESHSIDKIADIITLENTPIGDRFNMAYKTTIITHGRGEGIVIATGMTTEIGRIAKLLQENESKTPLQKRLSVFGKKLSVLVLFICIIIYGAGIIRGEDPIRMLLTAISVAVAAIPEALPAIVTIALALGAKKMVHKNALIRKLPAVETLGSVTFICSDKTGTITQNKMTVSDTWQPESIPIFNNYSSERLLLLLMELNHNVIADNTQELKGDPTEIALVEFTRKSNLYDIQWSNTFQRIYELPFDSIRKRMTTIYSFNKKWLIITKGAVEYILPLCNQTDVVKINSISDNFASQGKRVLAYAMNIVEKLPDKINNDSIEHHLFFTGLVAMIDPPRPESKQAISDCHQAGIMPIMITGDHPSTAKAIAVET
jgi:P-type Ca2+ transporter type 2C